jgi:hypothetical protein
LRRPFSFLSCVSYKNRLDGVYRVMDRKHIAAAVSIILIVAFYFAFTWNKGGTTTPGQANVITQGGTVTLEPKEGFSKFAVVADLRGTNTESKTSSNAATPKPR